MPLKVGKDVIGPRKYEPLRYSEVKKEDDGWVDPSKYLPGDYDLMLLRIEGRNPINGWSIGSEWDGLRLKPKDKVIGWKKIPLEYEEDENMQVV